MADKKAASKLKEQADNIKAVVAKITPLVKHWALENVQTREVANRLNQLSLEDKQIFSVHQSQHIGGSYEVIYYSFIEKPKV